MLHWIEHIVERAHGSRGAHIFVIVLRILIGFAFIPAGLKKILGQPFTDPAKTGDFHQFLHAFHDTGLFYRFVGATQLLAATLLMTQYYASLGAVIITPIVVAIFVLCWSTMVVPTASVVSLMLMGVSLLLLWDIGRWKGLLTSQRLEGIVPPPSHIGIDLKLWSRCGWLILVLYFGHTAITGEVYRPKGVEWSNPSFILLQVIAILPLCTFALDFKRNARRNL